jgi:DNA segregation ATPase FtsK/SpoIIIE-like protein
MSKEATKNEYIEILESLIVNLRLQVRECESQNNHKMTVTGFVYVIQQDGTNNYKIGMSTNYTARKELFQVKLPFNFKEIVVHETSNYKEVEQGLHAEFIDNRLNGSEFFELTGEQISSIPGVIGRIEDECLLSSIDIQKAVEVSAPERVKEKSESDAELVLLVKEIMQSRGISKLNLSSSYIQRRFSVGYARAARIKDIILEEESEKNK